MNILVGFNGSATSKKAIELSKKYAKAFNGVVNIFMSKPSYIADNSSEKKAERFWTDLKNAETDIEHYREEFRSESLNCFTKISAREIDAGTDLLEYAKMIEADVIIIGIEKISKVGKFLFGSTAQMVIHEANCPVVTVK
jgi:nucleotide-binding universal stress UspA family protein